MFLDHKQPFELAPDAKNEFLTGVLNELVQHHSEHCAPYANFIESLNSTSPIEQLETVPYLPVSVFKEFDLRSTEAKGMSVKSSATTTGQSSKIFVDKATRKRQSLSSIKIWHDFLGEQPRPYIVFDMEETVRGTGSMSARGAAILGLANLASELLFVMKPSDDGSLEVDFDALNRAVDQVGDQPFMAYGFTFILYQAHQQLAEAGWQRTAHSESKLMHSGGWKRLINLAVDKSSFNQLIAERWKLNPANVIDFYGTVEQVGMAYPDCSEGVKHVPYWADIIVRRTDSLAPTEAGEPGLLQLVNALPLSAPNFSVLTEDLAEIVDWDGCACGRRGKTFLFRGRAPRSEVRGCSDVGRA